MNITDWTIIVAIAAVCAFFVVFAACLNLRYWLKYSKSAGDPFNWRVLVWGTVYYKWLAKKR